MWLQGCNPDQSYILLVFLLLFLLLSSFSASISASGVKDGKLSLVFGVKHIYGYKYR